ncbi:MAG: hypothetical protein QOD07_2430 [Frankiaceae bacterium]|jgi:hypothetical protein|nr:hypothetical protein [Frankiaceae bacterium]
MPNGKYDFDYDEPLSLPPEPEAVLRALMGVSPIEVDDDEEDDGA